MRPRPLSFTDARLYQILALAGLLGYGLVRLDLEIAPGTAGLVLATVLLVQYLASRAVPLPHYDPWSALISGLSLCLLLRTPSLALAALVATVTIASKFVLRWRGKHLFNPTNLGLLVGLLVSEQVWVSPGQWGSYVLLVFLIVCAGTAVVWRAGRSDISFACLLFYALIVVGRAWWLGDPLAIPLHHLQNGAILIFAFFMISDPKTTPNAPAGRWLFALLVALGAAFVHFVLYRQNGFLWSLGLFSVLVPWIDRLFPGPLYQWPASKGVTHEDESDPLADPAGLRPPLKPRWA